MDLARACRHRTVVSACASSTEAIVNAYDHLQLGLADVVIAGGAEACDPPARPRVVPVDAGALAAQRRPGDASRPYDVDRDGFVMGEGAAAHRAWRPRSTRRPAARKIYAELPAARVTSDAYHITAPDPEGSRRRTRR